MPRLDVASGGKSPIRLYYEDHGAGKPVVLIHGWPLSSRTWENQLPALVEAGYRVVAYDRRGFGLSSQPWTGYDYDTFAADLDVLMRSLDLRGATLVGFSMGGGEVARYLGHYGPERVSKAVFASAVPPYLLKSKEHPEGALSEVAIAGMEAEVQKDRLAFLESFTKKFFSARKTLKVSEAQRHYARDIAEYASAKGTLDCIGAFSRTDFRPDLAKIHLPTLVLHGDSDGIVPFPVSGKRCAAAIAGAEVELIKGGPHGITASHPEEFNRALLAFLAK